MPGIIIVDNDEKELNQLQTAFFESGFPCLPIRYINDDPNNESCIDHVDIPDSLSPRIIICDLNLTDASSGQLKASNLVAPLAEVLKKIAKPGPYILCIWSKHTEEPAEVIKMLQERYCDDINLPLEWALISKSEFLDSGSSPTGALKEKVQGLLKERSLIHSLVDWEQRIYNAATKTTNALFEISKPSIEKHTNDRGTLINEHQENLKKVLAIIANETLGRENAKAFPSSALDSGLAPVLSDQLLSISDSSNDSVWKDAVPSIGEKVNLEPKTKAELNTFYHIESVLDNYPKGCRGVLVEFSPSYLSNKENDQSIMQKLGRKIESVIGEEFINSRHGDKTLRKNVRNDIRLGFLELSAECDQAQRKTKLNRYILAALIPVKHEEYTLFGTGDNIRKTSHNGIYRLPNIIHKTEHYILKVSFKYQFGITPETNKWMGDPILRVRDQVLHDIAYSAAQYSARPGIVRFE